MSVSSYYGNAGASSIYKSQAEAILKRTIAASKESEKKPFMLPEVPEEAPANGDTVSVSTEGKGMASQQAPVNYEAYRSFFARVPPTIVTRLTATGDFGPPGVELPMRNEYESLVHKYSQEVKEEFGVTESYIPHIKGMPEYDPKIEEAMEQALIDKLANDPKAMSCIQGLNVTFPPVPASEFNLKETSSYKYTLDLTEGLSKATYKDQPNARIWMI